jgi:predicted lipoprotein with Yx(FWY)xxD motif
MMDRELSVPSRQGGRRLMRHALATGLVMILSLMTFGVSAQEEPDVDVASDPQLGEYLVAANGRTLYQFTRDEEGKSVCYEACADEWLPFTAEEPLTLPEGVEGELTLIEREEADEPQESIGYPTQVAYNGIPLYYYHEDTEPGDINGQGADGIWFVVTPGQHFGDILATPSASPGASPAATPAATPAS